MKEKSQYTIYIDSSKRGEILVSLLKDSQAISTKSGDIDLVASIAQLLKENDLSVIDIVNFDVFEGPGSFTGLKKGVTVANVLNWALNGAIIEELKIPNYGSEPNIHPTKYLK